MPAIALRSRLFISESMKNICAPSWRVQQLKIEAT
jgi:hypothetical protein